MRIALLSLTKNGSMTGRRISQSLEEDSVVSYANIKYALKGDIPLDRPLGALVGAIFPVFDAIVFISSTGIAVRSIAPHLKDKRCDPAVVVVDELGENCISLLSGHLGGANRLARRIASGISANPVITTATDVQGKQSVEDLAASLDACIEDMAACKSVNTSIVNGGRVGIFSDLDLSGEVTDVLPLEKLTSDASRYDALIVVTNKKLEGLATPRAVLRPRNLVVGVGCKKGVSKEAVLKAVNTRLRESGLPPECVKHLSTAEIKKEEKGILEAADELGVDVKFIGRKALEESEGLYRSSSFVLGAVGVGAVCEPAAVLACRDGQLLQGKTAHAGVTVAIAQEMWRG